MKKLPIILTDLDDTLFQTKRKIGEGNQDNLAVMSTLEDGVESGYATPIQQSLLYWMRIGVVIPVTARSREVMARVNIDQAPAICSNGGCIITNDGEIDRQWHDQLKKQNKDSLYFFHDVLEEIIKKQAIPDIRYWMVSEEDLPLYLVFSPQAITQV